MTGFSKYRIGGKVRLRDIDSGDTPFMKGDERDRRERLDELSQELDELQNLLHAEGRRKLLLVLQGTDTSGKDGTVRWVFSRTSPLGVRVAAFKAPSIDERAHDFLWRCHAVVPRAGEIGVWNRSHYEDVLVVRVKDLVPEPVWRARYDQINAFEAMLTASGTTILKFFLHISKAEQKERLEARIATPEKHWKFDAADLVERESWDAYQAAFAEALTRCSTPQAPWHVVPADRKWYRNLLVARAIADTLEAMDPRFPEAQPGVAGTIVPG